MSRRNSQHSPKAWSQWTRVRLNADVLRNWRLGKQLAQRQAAKECKMSEVTYRRCEAGQPVLALTAMRLAQHLGFTVEELRVK